MTRLPVDVFDNVVLLLGNDITSLRNLSLVSKFCHKQVADGARFRYEQRRTLMAPPVSLHLAFIEFKLRLISWAEQERELGNKNNPYIKAIMKEFVIQYVERKKRANLFSPDFFKYGIFPFAIGEMIWVKELRACMHLKIL